MTGAEWGGIGKMAADFGTSAFGARKKYKRDKYMYKHRHQWEVADLKAAGLNPILSAGGSPGSPAAQAAFGAEGVDLYAAENTAKNIKMDTEKKRGEKDLLHEQDLNAGQTRLMLEEQTEKEKHLKVTAKHQADVARAQAAESNLRYGVLTGALGNPYIYGKMFGEATPSLGLGFGKFSGGTAKSLNKENATLRKRLKARQNLNKKQKQRQKNDAYRKRITGTRK